MVDDDKFLQMMVDAASPSSESGAASKSEESFSGDESDEVGYLFLESSIVQIVAPEGTASPNIPLRTWINVNWESQSTNPVLIEMKRPMCNTGETGESDQSSYEDKKPCSCPRCNLILHACNKKATTEASHESRNSAKEAESIAALVVKRPPHFNGLIADITKASCPACSALPCCADDGNRSDAALLAGVAFTCHHFGYISIRDIQILLLGNSSHDENSHDRAALIITFAMPQLTNSNPAHGALRSIVPSDSRGSSKTKRTGTKPLPPSTQLLLSLMSSEWEYLERQRKRLCEAPTSPHTNCHSSMFHMEPDGTLSKMKRTLFPKKLSLEELYLRFRGTFITDQAQATATPPSSILACLPPEVLVTSIAPFLRAKSLDNLRCSCKLLHHTLRAVVPGLKLRLYKHQIRSLEWMRRRETEEVSEKIVLDFGSKIFGSENVGGDMHRAVTGGGSTCLRLHPSSRSRRKAFRIDQQTGREISFETTTQGSFALSRRVARGGLLCDDPGLGKTITVLSLILQTSGLSSEPHAATPTYGSMEGLPHTDVDIFHAYWREHVPQIYRVQSFSKLFSTLRRRSPGARVFDHPVDPVCDSCSNYFDVIDRPMCLKEVERRVKREEYASNFDRFRADVDLCFQNALTYYQSGHPVHDVATEATSVFAILVEEFKAKQVQSAKKSFSRSAAKPNSSVAALLERRNSQELQSSLKPTAATLLVVPGTLLNHWEEQIKLHLDLNYISDKRPLIYHYQGLEDSKGLDLFCQIQKTHFPCVFIDKSGTKPLPPASFLKMFRFVITTTQRFANEWKNGSFEDELKQGSDKGTSSNFDEVGASRHNAESASSLLKIYWLRLIVDEGHSMGRGSASSAILFASWIMAQRRWAMTGTPTPQTVSQSGLTNIRGLMRFLQHDFFSARLDGERVWQGGIVRGWNSGNLSSFFRLHSLMTLLMVRHTKLDIDELQPPKFSRMFSTMSHEETKSYNLLVSGIQMNLLITSMEGKTSGRQDSILFRSNAKLAREAFTNLRLVCSGRSDVCPTIEKDEYLAETFDMLGAHGVDGVRLKVVQNYFQRALSDQLSGCNSCGLQLSTLLIVPCGHLICTECMDSKTATCPSCDAPFDVDDFQRVQPGITLTWHDSRERQRAKGMMVNDPSVPEEHAPAAPQAVNLAARVAIQPAPSQRTRRARFGDGHVCEYDVASSDGKCSLCLEEHFECVTVKAPRCTVCFKAARICPEEESKAFYLTKKLSELHAEYAASGQHHFDITSSRLVEERPLKVIVFSEFRKTLDLVGSALLWRFGGGCVGEFWGKRRDRELLKFAKSPDCFCMLLDKHGSEGLDLSFVTHIFFLEEIWDKSLENQAISRAWRMGAKGHVEVETIIARSTVEEMMIGVEKAISTYGSANAFGSAAGTASEPSSAKEQQRAKLLFLLKNLRLIRPQALDNKAIAHKEAKRSREVVVAPGKTGSVEEAPRKVARVRFEL